MVTLADKLGGRDVYIFVERDRKLDETQAVRQRPRRAVEAAKPAKRLLPVANVKAANYHCCWFGRRIGHLGNATQLPTQGPNPRTSGNRSAYNS